MRFNKLSALGLVFAFGLAACSDSTAPGDAFDSAESAADLAAVESAFDTDVFASLSAMGGGFSTVSQAPAVAAMMVDAGRISVTSPEEWREREVAIADLLARSGAQVLVIPESFRGRTYAHHPQEGWYHAADRTGAPENGMRFILYAVNPVTEDPTETEIGYVDVKDESTETAAVVRLIVVSGEVEYVNYRVTASGQIGSLSVVIDGFVTDGTETVEFTLSHSLSATFATASAEIDYEVSVPSRDFTAASREHSVPTST